VKAETITSAFRSWKAGVGQTVRRPCHDHLNAVQARSRSPPLVNDLVVFAPDISEKVEFP
jgi:hypothetical protein